jgi:ABC-2 type transport system permease protein
MSPITTSIRRSWHAYVAEGKYECVRALRTPGFMLPMVVLPSALYLFFGVVLAGTKGLQIDRLIFTGFSVMGVMGPGMFGFGVFVAMEREQGLLTLKRALPMPRGAYLLAKMLMTLLLAAIVMLTLIVTGWSAGRVTLTPSQFLTLAAISVTGSLPFCAIGLFIGSWAAGRSAPAFVNLLYLPMIYLSGFLIPLPKTIAPIQLVSPAYHLDRLALWAAGAPGDSTAVVHVAVLVGVTLLFGALALHRFVRRG